MSSLRVTNTFISDSKTITVEHEFGSKRWFIVTWEFWNSQTQEVSRTDSDVKMSISHKFSEEDFKELFR